MPTDAVRGRVAEGVGSVDNNDQVQFFSEIEEADSSLSGMSGGPVFWSTETTFGLLGFIKEAMGPPADGEDSISKAARSSTLSVSGRVSTCWRSGQNSSGWNGRRYAAQAVRCRATIHQRSTDRIQTEFKSMRKAGIQDYWFQIPNGPLLIACDVLLGQLHQARAEGTLPPRIG